MRALRAIPVVVALAVGGCAFVPQAYPRLEEAHEAYRQAAADPHVALHASAELRIAEDVLGQAIAARDTLGDPAVVDHLAYLARQRAILSIEMAKVKALQDEARATARVAAR